MACFISKHMPCSFHLHPNFQTEKQQLQSLKSILSFHCCAILRQKRCWCRWWKVWPSSYFKKWSNNWKSNMWWEKPPIYSDISARWLKIHNIFIGKSWWNVKLYSTEYNITNMKSRSRYIMQCTHTHKSQKDQELRHTPPQDKAACNTMKSFEVHCRQLIWCKRKCVQNNFQNVTRFK